LCYFVSDKNRRHRHSNNVMKILDTPLQISSLEEQQRITERPKPAWFSAEKKITTVRCLYAYFYLCICVKFSLLIPCCVSDCFFGNGYSLRVIAESFMCLSYGLGVRLSVCPSVCHTAVLCQNSAS